MLDNKNHVQSIDDILDNIRSAIKQSNASTNSPPNDHNNYDLLELTNIIQDDGTIHNLKKDCNITSSKQIQLSNKIISDSVITEKLLSDEVIAESTKDITDFVDQILRVKSFNEQWSADQLHALAVDVVKPYVQDWLNKNLPPIVREILNKEIKDLVLKTRSC